MKWSIRSFAPPPMSCTLIFGPDVKTVTSGRDAPAVAPESRLAGQAVGAV
jgi:hypothetical protein